MSIRISFVVQLSNILGLNDGDNQVNKTNV